MKMLKYPKIRRLGHDKTKGILGEGAELALIEKMDGCLPYNQIIQTEEGSIPIGEIVNKRMDVKVKSYNKQGEIEYREIESYFKNGKAEKWLEIDIGEEIKSGMMRLTPNHEVYTEEGKKQAGDLKEGDYLKIDQPALQGDFRDLVEGSLIGDAALIDIGKNKNSHLSETHGAEQKEYTHWKAEKLKPVSTAYENEGAYSEEYEKKKKYCYRTKSLKCFSELEDRFYESGKKIIPEDFELTKKKIAIWFGDDGNSAHLTSEKQRERIIFHTQGFKRRHVEILKEELEKLDYEATINNYGNGPIISLSADSTEKLYRDCVKYIPNGIMRKKVPEKYWNDAEEWNVETSLETVKVQDVEEVDLHNDRKYDIEVEGNHNYFTKNVLVSNSNFRFKLDEKSDMFLFGSRNTLFKEQGLPKHPENIGGQFAKVSRHINNKANKDKLRDYQDSFGELTIYGENMVKHTLDYEWDDIPQFLGFDVYSEKEGEFLRLETAKGIIEDIGLEFAPIVDRVEANKFDHEDYEIPESNYREGKAEGVVIRRSSERDKHGSWRGSRAKYLSEEFEEKHGSAKSGSEPMTDDEELVETYATKGRIRKHINKLVVDEGKDLEMSLMEELPLRVVEDIWQEEHQEIVRSNKTLDMKKLRSMVAKKCVPLLKKKIRDQAGGD